MAPASKENLRQAYFFDNREKLKLKKSRMPLRTHVCHDEKMAKNRRAPKVVNEGLVSHVSKDKLGHSSEHTWR